MLSAQDGHEQVARALLKAGANVNHSADDGRTALMQASQNGHEHTRHVAHVARRRAASAASAAALRGEEADVLRVVERLAVRVDAAQRLPRSVRGTMARATIARRSWWGTSATSSCATREESTKIRTSRAPWSLRSSSPTVGRSAWCTNH